MDNYRLIIIKNDVSKTIIVRNRNSHETMKKGEKDDPIEHHLLNVLDLENVPYSDFLQKSKKIKECDGILNELCAICHCNYTINEYKRTLDCNHNFHKKCIDKWLKMNLNCPLCRKDIGHNIIA